MCDYTNSNWQNSAIYTLEHNHILGCKRKEWITFHLHQVYVDQSTCRSVHMCINSRISAESCNFGFDSILQRKRIGGFCIHTAFSWIVPPDTINLNHQNNAGTIWGQILFGSRHYYFHARGDTALAPSDGTNGGSQRRERTPWLQTCVDTSCGRGIDLYPRRKQQSRCLCCHRDEGRWSSWSCFPWAVQNTVLLLEACWRDLPHSNRLVKTWCRTWGFLCV